MNDELVVRAPPPAWTIAVGDAAAILLFVIIGLANHDQGVTVGGVARTALPVLGAWFVVAPFTKTYARPRLGTLLINWVIAVPVGVAIRGTMLNRSADDSQLTFGLVAMIGTLVLLLLWRGIHALRGRPSKR